MYQAAADYIVDANQALDDVVAIVRSFGRYHSAPESSVYVGATLPRRLLPPSLGREQAVVVAQPGSLGVARAVMARLESEVDALALIELDDREAAKTVASIETLYGSLASLNVGRHDTIVAVGGGAVTDVAGFAAATWLRGIEWVSVPTTMLGAVDASIGGKTGINVGGKNLVGAFWHASQVSISLGILDALDDDLRREGAAEAIKAGFLFDPTIVSLYRDHGLDAPSSEVVRRAVALKAAIVFGDFRESGQRALLNFGHTIGHGIETASGMPHGYAIAIGMIAAAEVSARRYDFDADLVRAPLAQLGLPLAAPALDPDDVMPFISRDKKRTANGLRMVLLREIGDPTVELVSDADVAAGLAAVGIG